MELALSTSWNAFRYENGKDVVREIKALGFENLELGFNLTSSMVEDIAALEGVGQVKIVSLHNFCPIPDGVERKLALPDYYSLASLNHEERALAVKFTKRTIDTAKKLNAQAVVLHTGRIEIQDKTRVLMRFFNNGKSGSKELLAVKEMMAKEREQEAKPYFESALISLEELNQYAVELGVKLGIENRYYFREIPSYEETKIILDKFSKGNIFYWHDVGHAQVWENLGFHPAASFLENYGDRLLGIHLHDCLGTDDHRAPLLGKVDFSKLAPFLKKDTIKVIEAHSPATAEEVKKGAQYLQDMFNRGRDD